jgi:hypothetical protein
MKRTMLGIATAALLAAALPGPAAPALAAEGHVNFTLGQKMFDEDDWSPIEKQTAFGAEAAFAPGAWPVEIALHLMRSADEEARDMGYNELPVTLDASTWELGAGLSKTFSAKRWRPYVGAGAVYAKTDLTANQGGTMVSDEGSGWGYWAGAGVFYRIGTGFNFGGGARYSSATVDFDAFQGQSISYDATEVEAGGVSLHVLIGWSWPKLAP